MSEGMFSDICVSGREFNVFQVRVTSFGGISTVLTLSIWIP